MATAAPPKGLDPLFYALSKLRRAKYDDAAEICSSLLAKQPRDQAAWLTKTRALTEKDFIDDTDVEEEGIAEVLMDDNAIAKAPRPGTSLKRPTTGAVGASSSGGRPTTGFQRPMSSSGRPLTGFARPGTQSRGSTARSGKVEQAFEGARPGTSRPATSAGRFLRLGTQSMLSAGAKFIDVERVDVRRFAQRPAMAKALFEFLAYSEHAPRRALELAAEATKAADFNDWWWKARLGKAYYQLGLFRDAERQFLSALKQQPHVTVFLELAKVYLRLDQPLTALATYGRGLEAFPNDVALMVGIARVHDLLNEIEKGVAAYRRVLAIDPSNVEAVACLASHLFYTDQPELALRLYRRLLQTGVHNAEIWNNVALCCYHSAQFDLALTCFDRALALAGDDALGDIWYNIGTVAVSAGDSNLAYQAFKVAVSLDPKHAEAFNNLGVLELRKGHVEQARSNFESGFKLAPQLFEPYFNAALLAFKLGDCQDSFSFASKALEAYPEHTDSQELLKQLHKHFSML